MPLLPRPGTIAKKHVRTVIMNSTAVTPLMGVSELAAALATRPPVVLDVRWILGSPSQHNAYLAGHIPGAQFCDLDADLADPPGPRGRHPLPDPVRLQRRARQWGIADDSDVVVYDAASSTAAARAWWVLRWAGVESVRVLDGGLAAWTAVDGALVAGPEQAAPGSVTLHPGSLPVLAAGDAAQWARSGRLVDARAPERFLGELEPIDPVAGHIPGAVNVPSTSLVTSSGHLRPVEELQGEFAAAGLATPDGSVGVYCGSGVTAATAALALTVLGRQPVLYPGSWSEWINDPQHPVARG